MAEGEMFKQETNHINQHSSPLEIALNFLLSKAAWKTTPPPEVEKLPQYHLLLSLNYARAEKVSILATGFPEKAGQYSTSKYLDLNPVFEALNGGERVGFAQIYTGPQVGSLSKLPSYLQQAIQRAHRAQRIDLATYSAGALSLVDFQPDERIRSLTLACPVTGLEAIKFSRNPLFQSAVKALKVPSAEQYFASTEPGFRRLLEAGTSIRVLLGNDDPLIDSRLVQRYFEKFMDKLPKEMQDNLIIQTGNWGHVPEVDELVTDYKLRKPA